MAVQFYVTDCDKNPTSASTLHRFAGQEDKTGDWCPGKGFSVPAELAAKLCENIGKVKQKGGG